MNKEPSVIGRPDFEHAVEASKLSSQVRLEHDNPSMDLFIGFISRSTEKYFILDNIFNCKNKPRDNVSEATLASVPIVANFSREKKSNS